MRSIDDDEYRGPATLHVDDGPPINVDVRMSARFEPVEGRFRWAGRTGPHAALREQVSAGASSGRIVLPGGTPIAVRLGEPDPWGGIRISGAGVPPWSGVAS
ncbi:MULTISPECIES: DUF4873 domain-containing protein [Actinoplanes]|uniref:DUF4873 domain-containing protein n=1 Tax=Actinoplanes TaxID=1865 RepID=UPI0005F2C8C1|nr:MULTISPECIES: DUF4873 domain-containing protein [Actinoplanes]GLY00557.1 DUF4873 domain-containing protein [Actinoplanes sp. NBRC 101535]